MSERGVRVAVGIVAAVGVGVAAYLTYVRYSGGSVACSTGGCEKVRELVLRRGRGRARAVVGLIGHLLILAAAFVRGEAGAVVGGGLTLVGFAFAMFLLYAQLAIIDAVYLMVIGSDVVMTVLLVLALVRLRVALRSEPVSAQSPG